MTKMMLSSVVRGRIERPVRALIYGQPGVGKSTFAAHAPSPIFLGAEDGTSQLDVARFPEPKSWKDAHDAIGELRGGAHDFRTLAIDSLDWLEPLCWRHVCETRVDKREKKQDSIEGFGYGQGYVLAVDEWRQLCAHLDMLRVERTMNIVLIAHSHVKAFRNPDGDDFDRYEMKLNKLAVALIREWVDCVLFAQHEMLVRTANDRAKGVSSGARIMHTETRAAWDAKNRYDLPPTMPLSWTGFAAAIAAHSLPPNPAALTERIESLLTGVSDEIATRVREAMKKAEGKAPELARIAGYLAAQKGA